MFMQIVHTYKHGMADQAFWVIKSMQKQCRKVMIQSISSGSRIAGLLSEPVITNGCRLVGLK